MRLAKCLQHCHLLLSLPKYFVTYSWKCSIWFFVQNFKVVELYCITWEVVELSEAYQSICDSCKYTWRTDLDIQLIDYLDESEIWPSTLYRISNKNSRRFPSYKVRQFPLNFIFMISTIIKNRAIFTNGTQVTSRGKSLVIFYEWYRKYTWLRDSSSIPVKFNPSKSRIVIVGKNIQITACRSWYSCPSSIVRKNKCNRDTKEKLNSCECCKIENDWHLQYLRTRKSHFFLTRNFLGLECKKKVSKVKYIKASLCVWECGKKIWKESWIMGGTVLKWLNHSVTDKFGNMKDTFQTV